VRTIVLSVHVVAGTAGLLLGPLLLTSNAPHRQVRIGYGYQVAVAILAGTAVGLVLLAGSRLWWLAPIAVATEAAALGGRWAGRRGLRGWQIRLLGGSYVSLVTALFVVSWFTLASWLLPAAVMVPLIETAAYRSEHR